MTVPLEAACSRHSPATAMEDLEFIFAEPIDLTNCDREPIHIPGSIQPHGVLLVLQEPQLTCLQASENVNQFFKLSALELVGQDLTVLFPEETVSFIRQLTFEANLEYCNPIQLHATLDQTHYTFDGILHRSEAGLILELEPKSDSRSAYPLGFYHQIKEAVDHIRQADDFTQATEWLAREVRQLTGYDRVMIYQFEADESGIVIAEDRRDSLESYLGLHYPASDIPKQARKLYYNNWLRLIPDVGYQPVAVVPTLHPLTQAPLDLSFSTLRSVSPLHVEYLQNMGVAASFSISLINESKLWGLIVCHHYQPRIVNYETRKACEFLGQFMSVELFKHYQKDLSRYQIKVKAIRDQLRNDISNEVTSVGIVLQQHEADLLDLVDASGAAICLQNELTLVGQTPSLEIVQTIFDCVSSYPDEVFYTNCLSQYLPEAEAYKDQVSGVLAIAIGVNELSYRIIWFRPEVIQTVSWGGDPTKPVIASDDGELRLSPRQSFDLWKETVSGKSLPWLQLEVEAAAELKNTLMLAALKFSQTALEEVAERAEVASRTKSEFLANMSHEIRTPMNAILGFCDLLDGLVNEPRQRTYLQSIATSGRSLLALINDILDLSKIEAGKLELNYEPMSISRLAQEIQQIFHQKAAEKGLFLTIEIAPSVPSAICFDEVRLRQILFNLVGNAIKFTEQGGVSVIIAAASNPNQPDQTQLVLNVEDTGIGVAADQQTRVFDAFVQSEGQSTRKYGGTGLGLAITQRLTHMLGGTIDLHSQLGQGSRFIVTFPNVSLSEPPSQPLHELQQDSNLNQFQAVKILVVDDVASNRDLIQGYFAETHHELLFAVDGQEALNLMQTELPDLILLDLRMPHLNGQSVARQLKNDPRTCHIPILILTASSQQIDQVKMLATCEGFLRKPVSRYQLIQELKRVLSPSEDHWAQPIVEQQAQPEPSSLKQVHNFSDLLSQLQQLEHSIWPQLQRTLKNRDLQYFSKSLLDLAQTYDCPPLLDYAVALKHQIDAFAWEQLPQTVADFPDLLRSLDVLSPLSTGSEHERF